MLIGDNLSSHFTREVLRLCKDHNIDFVCLPPNATHLCQPLDVSFFGPMKNHWKQLLIDWKKSNPNSSSVEKSVFPRLLKKLFDKLAPTAKQNSVKGFYSSGIYPISKDKLLSKIPQDVQENENANNSVGEVLVNFLKEQRNPKKRDVPTKRKKLNIVPGKSVAYIDSPEKDDQTQNLPSTSKVQSIKRKIVEESDEEAVESDFHEETNEISNAPVIDSIGTQHFYGSTTLHANSWVIVQYQTKKTVKHFIGKVLTVNKEEDEMCVNFLKLCKSGKFVWPEVKDCATVSLNQVKRQLCEPKTCRRGEFSFDLELSAFNFK